MFNYVLLKVKGLTINILEYPFWLCNLPLDIIKSGYIFLIKFNSSFINGKSELMLRRYFTCNLNL